MKHITPVCESGHLLCLEICGSQLLKLQRPQNKVLPIISNFPRRTPTLELHVAFQIPNVYDFSAYLSRQKAEVIQNHDNEYFYNVEQGEAQHRK